MGEKTRPLVVGIPGFIAVGERSRTTDVLERLSEEDFATIDFRYSGFVSDGTGVRCDFNLEKFLAELRSSIDGNLGGGKVDLGRIGFYASSFGAGVLSMFFSQELNFRPRCVSTVSPLVDWIYFSNEKTRAQMETIDEIDISDDVDRASGRRRTLSAGSLSELKKIKGIEVLKGFDRRVFDLKVQTVYGSYDGVSAPNSMKGYHIALGGDRNELHPFECGHNLPRIQTTNLAVSFFRNYLRR